MVSSKLAGLAQQAVPQIAQRLVGRLSAGGQEQRHERRQLVHLRLDEAGEDVVGGIETPLADDGVDVSVQGDVGLPAPLSQLRIVPQALHHRLIPLMEALVVGRWEAEHPEDDPARHERADLTNEVEPTRIETTDDRVDDVFDEVAVAIQAGGREDGCHDLSQFDVRTPVHLEERATEHGAEGLAVQAVREPSRVGEPGDHVLVPGDDPDVIDLVVEDRGVASQLRPDGKRVEREGRVVEA
jgi:hypothetical protein